MHEQVTKKAARLDSLQRMPAEEVLSYLSLAPDDHVLDLGAGTGYLSLPLAPLVTRVFAADHDQSILDYLETKALKLGLTNVSPLLADFRKLPLANGTIDKTVASISLHEVSPLHDALTEIYRTLKPGGRFLCLELEKQATARGPRVTANEMEQSMRASGFNILEIVHPDSTIANQPVYIIIAKKES
ncbi:MULTISPECIES: class I SAM-dependent methyltransferase [Exiguobacterium]|uniref:class I SAM-dependent methyltransferase n=1 Tax=Exiguobacterium TaxID=33986 RepID=UPI001BE56C2C|nr:MULTISPECIES: class I SAM-dependent methyltransferase [Exiguobacterium]MCT4775813.1 methyltransferase domain-containing protein [Exiguobacterium aquaticum]MCT4789862.1 methyltransferase domain-containing protein [Exiguobacterium mexicanum]